jgi:hypothetical protein
MNLRKPLILLAIAAITSLAICHYWKPIPYNEKLVRIKAEQLLGPIDERITREPLEIQAVLLGYSDDKELTLKAWIALSKFPVKARNIFLLYGSEDEFKSILRSYGDAIIPVVQYFIDHEVQSLVVMKKTGTLIDTVSGCVKKIVDCVNAKSEPGPVEQKQSPELGPTERGWYAINFIKEEGHSFLGEFKVGKNNDTHWVQTQRITNALALFFTGGIRAIETKYQLSEEITTGDVFFASLDVIPLVVAVKLLRAGKGVVTSGKVIGTPLIVAKTSEKELTLMSRTKLLGSRLIPKGAFFRQLGTYGAAVATAYVVITHPSLVNSLLEELAELLGLNPLLVQFSGWLLIIAIALYPFSWALIALARLILFGMSLIEKSGKQLAKTVTSSSPDVARIVPS